jgi:carbon-monoxide dehydrogenase medium subunit
MPRTCEEAVSALADAPAPAALVAGATDLCAQCNEGADFASLVDLRGIPELRTIERHPGELRIGSMVSLFELGGCPELVADLPGLAAAFRIIANPRVRFRATVGGNIMARRTRYEASLLLTAARADLVFQDPTGTRRMAIADFLAGGAPPHALLRYIAVPLGQWEHFSYDRTLRPVMTLAFAAWADDAGPQARAVVATEYLAPVMLPVERAAAHASSAQAAADSAFRALPDDYTDAVSSNWYIRTAGSVMLARKLEALQ